ncbi:uncharacterized protein Bfra_000024 [Botrytis fragariae]|uniref:Uncharacterized protein n=1 Tax=Botrytis fragariae TaxID=1964551 RepID=A0A8H6EMN4_9HELO|nr:uncharacterized protein Bfra_000024 [Botrytis fragariae]KAF5877862.1 hypothetical protein Bfra_000024 [Botrytis fragariae]
MKTQDNHKDESHIPMRFRILIYALVRGTTQTAFMQAYNEILSNVEETECDSSPEMRQSMVERQVWTKFVPDETSPPPLEFPVAEGYFDPPVSRKAVEQYRIWQISCLESHQNQKSDSKPQYNKMKQSESNDQIPDIGSVDSQLRYSSNDVIRGEVGGCQLGRNKQSQPVDTNAGTGIMRNNSTRLSNHITPTSEKKVHAKRPQRARTYEGVMHNNEIIPIGYPVMDDLTISLRVDKGNASMPNQLIRPSRSTSSMSDHFNQ